MTGSPPPSVSWPSVALLLLAVTWNALPALGRVLEWLGMVGSLLAQELVGAVWERLRR